MKQPYAREDEEMTAKRFAQEQEVAAGLGCIGSAAKQLRRQPHESIDDEVAELYQVIKNLKSLLNEIGHIDAVEELVGSERPKRALSDVLNNAPGMIKAFRSDALNIIEDIHNLLFNPTEDK